MSTNLSIVNKVKETLIKASSIYRPDQLAAFKKALETETNQKAKWVLKQLIENSYFAERNESPLCDDTGIPHLFLEVGKKRSIESGFFEDIHEGIAEGLKNLPGRPMAILGNDIERLEQSGGLDSNPSAMIPAPIFIKTIDEDILRLNILMQGGGPEIRGKTYRVFHKHSVAIIVDEIVSWAVEEVGKLGCTPCSIALGIGRSHYEATSLMLEAMAKADFSTQNSIENEITNRVNESGVGPLGLGGDTTALATFLKVGPQRASGVRIVSMRLCCCVEPRAANVIL